MVVRVTRGLTTNTVFGRQLEAAVNAAIAKDADRLAAEAVRRVDAIVAKEFNNARTGDRRRPGKHLHGSFTAKVTVGSGPYPVVITLESDAPTVKVKSLNKGSAPHEIGADGGRIAFRSGTTGGQTRRGAAFFKQRQAVPSGRGVVVKGPVQHPGTLPSWFMQRALEQAVAAVYHKTVRIPRR